jgi:hypothetical protein
MTDIIELANNGDYDALEALGFYGSDLSLEISMSEYNLALKTNTSLGDLGEVTVLYKRYASDGETWDCITQNREYFVSKINESWFDKSAFFSFVGVFESTWLTVNLIYQISDLISYYGVGNIM